MTAVRMLTDAGLGLDHDALRLERTTEAWVTVGAALRDEVAVRLVDVAAGVEQIGSSSVVGILAKPIVDLAAGLAAPGDIATVRPRLEAAGWTYRGDAGEHGGQVFVLEARPCFRVAHLHAVDHDGRQWRDYLGLRDLLRRDPEARSRYEQVKAGLVEQHGTDRETYTEAKSDIVTALLREGARRSD